MKCRNSKSSRQRLHTLECKYLGFHTVNGYKTLRIHLYNPSPLACKVWANLRYDQKFSSKAFKLFSYLNYKLNNI